MELNRLPQNDQTNAWNTILPERFCHSRLDGDVKADWMVVGAGYAGLSAARRLAENFPDLQVAVVEAGVCVENASGRNSGFVIDVPHTTPSKRSNLENARRHLRLARAATESLASIQAKHSIACDWSQPGLPLKQGRMC